MCYNQFCFKCDAPYYGRNSVPELGNAAHKPFWRHATRKEEHRPFQRPEKSTTATGVVDEKVEGVVECVGESING